MGCGIRPLEPGELTRHKAGAGENTFLTPRGTTLREAEADEGTIVGLGAIMRYLKLKKPRDLYTLIDEYSLPVLPRHDGVLMTTVKAIDQWLFLASDVNKDVYAGRGMSEPLREKQAPKAARWLKELERQDAEEG